MRFERARRVIGEAATARAFSGAAAEIGTADGPSWRHATGHVTQAAAAPAVAIDSVFDLASLTKVLATTTLALLHVGRGTTTLDARVADSLPAWCASDRAGVTLRDLLEHASGLPGHRPYFREIAGRAEYEQAIAREPLEYAPRSRAVYSDLGFMLLGFVLEELGGAPLDVQFSQWRATVGLTGMLQYNPPRESWPFIVATEHDAWRTRLLQGEVHDENAAALGGVAAHAGLFGTAPAVGDVARWWLRLLAGAPHPRTGITAATAATFAARSTVPGSSRALGWDTMLPASSCGTRLSPRAVGHTGFTGTSLWIDPDGDRYFVLLTNRVHPSRENTAITALRRDFHEAAAADLDASRGEKSCEVEAEPG